MSEHRIQFRGGWEVCGGGNAAGVDRRLSLPTAWPAGLIAPIRLVRRFGRPPIDPVEESIRLELRGVPGLRRLSLNGVDLGSPPLEVFDWSVPLVEPLAARNTLILELILPVGSSDGWGSIALVIESKGQAGPSS